MKSSALNKKRTLAGVLLLLALSFYAVSCSKSSDSGNGSKGPGANEVFIQNMAFDPATLTVTVNTTVTWTNKDAVTHTVTSNEGLFNSGNIPAGGTFSYTFTTAGSFSYRCTIHPNMLGEVKVNAASGY